jgi:hypothetical protein
LLRFLVSKIYSRLHVHYSTSVVVVNSSRRIGSTYLIVSSLALRSGHAADEVVGQLLQLLVLNFGELLVNLDARRPA